MEGGHDEGRAVISDVPEVRPQVDEKEYGQTSSGLSELEMQVTLLGSTKTAKEGIRGVSLRCSKNRKERKVAIISEECFDFIHKVKWRLYDRRSARYAVFGYTDEKGTLHTLWMHRYIWEVMKGRIPEGMQIDHKNGDGLDNRIGNLRLCTCSQNNMNRRVKKIGASSTYKGVGYNKKNKKWTAHITRDRKVYSLGSYDLEIDAAKAYDKKAKELFGKFVAPNFK